MLEQVFRFNHVESGQRCRGADWAFFVRVMAQRTLRRDVEIGPGDCCGHRYHAAAEPLAEHEDVRRHAAVFAAKHSTGTTESKRDFIENEQRVVSIAQFAHAPPIRIRRTVDRGAAHRLGNDRADVALLDEDLFDGLGVRRRAWPSDVKTAGQKRAESVAKQRFASDRDGIQRRAMKRVEH